MAISIRGQLQNIFLNLRHRRGSYRALNHMYLSSANALYNVRFVQDRHPGFHIIPVVKANAYGHGLKEMAQILNGADCDMLAVDGYFEAAKIRFITKHKLLVIGYILPENVPVLDTKRCSFVVQDIQALEAFGRLMKPVKIHLEINTGMNRLGVTCDEVPQYLETLKQYPLLDLEGVMTHLADADDDTDNSFTDNQVQAFDHCMQAITEAGFSPTYVHIAQTAGSTKVSSRYANAVRLGIGLYGVNPLTEKDEHYHELQNLKPVLTLTSTIVKTMQLKVGEKVSYNGIFTAPRDMRIGVLPLGYYEGVPRKLSNTGMVMSGSATLPIIGRVCMNHTMVDLKNINLQVGDEVIIFDADPAKPNAVANVCAAHSIFPYVLFVKLSSSIRRRIV